MMTLQETQIGLAKLKAAYPNAKAFDDIANELYVETLMGVDSRDWQPAFKDLIGTCKFLPSISEIQEAVTFCRSRRLAFEESQDRRKRLALDGVMDPKAAIHREVVGPNHARFLRLLRGEEKFPEPEYLKRKPTQKRAGDANGYVPITEAERMRRMAVLRAQAAELEGR